MQTKFKVWGRIDGVEFSEIFDTVAEWRAERRLIERQQRVSVLGYASVQVTP